MSLKTETEIKLIYDLADIFISEKQDFINKNFDRTYKLKLKNKKWYEPKSYIRSVTYNLLEITWIQLQLSKLQLQIFDLQKGANQ